MSLSQVIHPYPTQAEAIKKVADSYSRTRLTPGVKKLFSRWLSWVDQDSIHRLYPLNRP